MITKPKPTRRTIRSAIRGSVPEGRLSRAKIALTAEAGDLAGGFVEFDRSKKDGYPVTRIATPDGMRASDITVRGHETRHATFHSPPPRRKMTEQEAKVSQFVDDVNIETKPLPATMLGDVKAYRRAHIATAMREVAGMKRAKRDIAKGKPSTAERRNAMVMHALRALAMIRTYGEFSDNAGEGGKDREYHSRLKGEKALKEAIGDKSFRALGAIINVARNRRTRARAVAMLLAILEDETDPESEMELEELPPLRDGDILAPVSHGDGLDGHMRIIDLKPKSVFTSKEKTINRRFTSDGVIINPNRFLSAVINGDGTGLFMRRVRQKAGGTVVIDASGSMSADATNLKLLCETIPTATVAYYNGSSGGRGQLTIYAKDGRRYAGALPHETLQSGNAVDLPALRWLMRMPKPWYFVSDLKFTGGTLGSEVVAKALVERTIERGDLTHYQSLQDAYTAFGGKGHLHAF